MKSAGFHRLETMFSPNPTTAGLAPVAKQMLANVEGVQAVFEAVKPLLAEQEPELATEIETPFVEAYRGVRNFGYAARDPDLPRPSSPGTAFVLYKFRSPAEFHRLGEQIEGLAEPLSRVPAAIAEEYASR